MSVYPLVVRLYIFWLYDCIPFGCTTVYHLVVRLSLCEINRHSVALCAVSRWTLGEAKSVTLRLWQFFSHPSFFRYIEGTYILYIYKLLYTTYRLKLAKNGVPPSKKNCHNCNCNVFELNEGKNALSFSRYHLIEFQISSHRVPDINS